MEMIEEKVDVRMKILILSDSHGLTDELSEIKARHAVDYRIHCGDSELDIDAKPLEGYYKVAGNCDFDERYPNEEVLELGGVRFLVVHGHLHHVNQGLDRLSYRAEEVEADIICFGHTHVAMSIKNENQLFINPGSIKQSRGDIKEKTYAILEWDTAESIKLTYYTLDGSRFKALDNHVNLTTK
jgi:hypothetical protein